MNNTHFLELLTPILLQPLPAANIRRGRSPQGERAMTHREIKRRHADKRRHEKLTNIAVLDMETDPFDVQRQSVIKPFAACLYRDDAEPIIIWEENDVAFVDKVLDAINGLPGSFTIYAHNGGKFDYMFLLHKLRGFVSFKGRGIMSAKIGEHELRDSFHIIPERLSNIQKDKFDYQKMHATQRHKYKGEIIRYLVNDCVYLLDVVKKFIAEFGLRLSIGQAAIAELRKHYVVKRFGENQDAFIRNYFYGGRVECLAGRGHFRSDAIRSGLYKLFDINASHPNVMGNYRHPIGNQFTVRRGLPGVQTAFIELECRNYGALVKRGDDGEISANYEHGIFRTTIWEYEAALRHGLIEAVEVRQCIDFAERSDFSKFVTPLYTRRMETKKALKLLQVGTVAHFDMKKDDMFLKLIMNNAYGKFAQNPRRFKECYITEPGELPAMEDCSPAVQYAARMFPEIANKTIMAEWGGLPENECENYWIWSRPQSHLRFNNVATAASITGAARAVLLDAIATADDPIYCDTDSIICRGLRGVELHNENLGAWKCEAELDEIIIAGKKLYGYKIAGLSDCHPERVKIRSKGVQNVTWRDLERMLDNEMLAFINPAPTMTKAGTQHYMSRNVRATVGQTRSRIFHWRAA